MVFVHSEKPGLDVSRVVTHTGVYCKVHSCVDYER